MKKIVLDLHDAIQRLVQRNLFSLNMKWFFYRKMETRRGVIQNMETVY